MGNLFKFALCFAFLLTAACEDGIDTTTENLLYPFELADLRNSVPKNPPKDMKQIYLNAIDHRGKNMKIHTWYFNANSDRTVVYLHGNFENLQTVRKKGDFERFKALGFNIVAVDYPGLGRSNSKPNEHNLTQAGLVAVDFAVSEFKNTELILWGKSLGAGVAAQVAPLVQPYLTGLVLTTPWASFPSLAISKTGLARQISERWMSQHTYDSVRSARLMNVPTLVQHGKRDKVVPYKFGQELYEAFPEGVAVLHTFPKLNHNNIFEKDRVWNKAEEFLKAL